jgi:ribonuclease HII
LIFNYQFDQELQLDSVEANCDKFKRIFLPYFSHVTAECGADERLVAVSAASIVAKVERDRAVAEIEKQEGWRIGSGYPSDPVTNHFLKMYYQQHKKLPPFIRHTWVIKKTYAMDVE